MRGPIDATVRVPGSKSITNRALLIAALASGESQLSGGLDSVDTQVMRDALAALGARIDTSGESWQVVGTGGHLRAPKQLIFVENSGTSARFLTAALSLADGPTILDGNERMRERPILDLADALKGLGAPVEIQGVAGCPPVRVAGGGIPGGEVVIDARQSSQYVSAILLAAPYAGRDVSLGFVDDVVVSRPYIELTLDVMRTFGAEADWNKAGGLWVRAGRGYEPREYTIEPDASSAVYPMCAAAIAGGTVRIEDIPTHSVQPDFAMLGLLERMGCQVSRSSDSVEVRGSGERLKSLGTVNMNAAPDAALALAVVALFADGPTLIENVGNLRIKETDRLAALEAELRRLGARAEAGKDWLHIRPGPLHGAEIETYDDHRMAMAFSLAGLRVPDVVILDPGCVSKTWPNFFEVLEHL